MSKKHYAAVAAILLTTVLWGLSFLSIKISVAVIPPMTLAFLRFLMSMFILLAVLKIVEPGTKMSRKDSPYFLMAGIIGITLYFFFENNGVKLTSASVASIIIATIPILSLLAESLFFKKKLTLKKGLFVMLSFIGVYLVVGPDFGSSSGSMAGNLLMFGAAVSWVAYNIVTRPLGKKYSQLAVVTYQTIFGTATLLPFALLERSHWVPVSTAVIFNVIYLGLFCSALGYYLYVFALKELGVGTVSLYINLIPVVTVVGSYYILKENFTALQTAGGLLILLSVYLATFKQEITPKAAAVMGQETLGVKQGG